MAYKTLKERYSKFAACLPASAKMNGSSYYFSEGIAHELRKDYSSAKKNFLIATALGNGEAAMHLGFLYHYGLGTDVDIERALKHYKYAIQLGLDEAAGMIDEMAKEGLIDQNDRASSKQKK